MAIYEKLDRVILFLGITLGVCGIILLILNGRFESKQLIKQIEDLQSFTLKALLFLAISRNVLFYILNKQKK